MNKTQTVVEDKRVIRAWCMYDWANSVYSLSIATAIFPIYYSNVTSANGGLLSMFGFEVVNTSLYSYTISAAFLIIAILCPMLSGIADVQGNKKYYMRMFCVLGALSCIGLSMFTGISTVALGILFFLFATVGYAGSIVFYNAFLPEICQSENQDKVSARGFSLGYIGSTLLLIINLAFIMLNEQYQFVPGNIPARIAFVMVGLWWLWFGLRSINKLPGSIVSSAAAGHQWKKGYSELTKVFNELKGLANVRNFLIAFFIYNMAVQTVMYVASLFGKEEIKNADGTPMEDSMLIATILVIQLVGIIGATLFAYLSKKWGNKIALIVNLVIWFFVCIGAYYTYTPPQFIALAFVVGMVMGGVQALSRSTYSKMLPHHNDNASYFSFYDVCDRVGTVVGTIVYGALNQFTGSMRTSVIVITLFFALGILAMMRLQNGNKPAATSN